MSCKFFISSTTRLCELGCEIYVRAASGVVVDRTGKASNSLETRAFFSFVVGEVASGTSDGVYAKPSLEPVVLAVDARTSVSQVKAYWSEKVSNVGAMILYAFDSNSNRIDDSVGTTGSSGTATYESTLTADSSPLSNGVHYRLSVATTTDANSYDSTAEGSQLIPIFIPAAFARWAANLRVWSDVRTQQELSTYALRG